MSTKTFVAKLARQLNSLIMSQRARPLACNFSTLLQPPMKEYTIDDRENKNFINSTSPIHLKDAGTIPQRQIGENVSKKHKIDFLVKTLIDLEDSKDAIYGTLDAWVAWERDFPIGSVKHVLFTLEKEHQWHKVIQVIKWMLSKGQGNTRNTYGQLIQALDMDHRFEEAHEIWKKKLAFDLHSVPWKLCRLMISVYFRNNRLEDLVKLFKGLEAYDRKPPEKSIVQKVADAYEILDMADEKEKLLEKYKDLFDEKSRVKLKKIRSSTRSPNNGKTLQIADFSRNVLEFDLSKVVFPDSLTSLDLNHNRIMGSLPQRLVNLNLQYLNVSYNRLCGEIPVGGKLQDMDYTEYFHNRCLCGAPLPPCK